MLGLSIIIPMYNAEKYIGECLQSILNQNLPDDEYEIIIVDDGSTDASAKIVERYRTQNPVIKLISQSNAGQSSARNKGVSLASGTFLCFVDADDLLVPDSLSRVWNYVVANGLAHSGGPEIITYGICGGSNSEKNTDEIHTSTTNGIDYIAKTNYNNGPWWYLSQKEFLQRNGIRFEEGKLCEDGMFTMTALLKAKHILVTDVDVYRYIIRPSSTVTTRNPERIKKLHEGFRYAVTYINSLIEENRGEMSEACLRRILARRDSYAFFLLARLVRDGALSELRHSLQLLKANGAYPMRYFIGEDYNGLRFKMMCGALNLQPVAYAANIGFKILNTYKTLTSKH